MSEQPFQPPRPERIEIPGPMGPLEAIMEVPDAGAGHSHFGVICHPHPLQGGTMTNKVVHTLARTFNELGVPTLRFNYRGVGGSAGTFDNSVGETDDALAVIEYGRQLWLGASPWVAGFSFGGVVAIRAAQAVSPELLVSVAPAVTRLDVAADNLPKCPWLLVQGDADDVVPPQPVLEWVERLAVKPQVHVMPGAGHFFHGRLNDLRSAVLEFCRKEVWQ